MTDLILGTAQLGFAYGATNAVGRPDDDALHCILIAAEEAGIDRFDTSPDYGDAQTRLGAAAVASSPRYITKFALDQVADAEDYPAALSARQLGVQRLDGVLFHRTADLRDSRSAAAWAALGSAQLSGRVRRRGASIYDADDLGAAITALPGLDLLQVPGSIVDRRLLDDPRVAELHDRGVEVHVRSAFLQGLLLLDPDRLPRAHAGLAPALHLVRSEARDRGVSVAALALAFLRSHPVVDAVVVGTTSADELRETASAWATPVPDAEEIGEVPLSEEVLDPRNWTGERS